MFSAARHRAFATPVLFKESYRLNGVIAVLSGFALALSAQAQFYDFTRAIPQLDTNGVPLAGANTTFADGSTLQPVGNDARSSYWAWRPYGDQEILSSLGPSTSTPPTGTKELVTTVSALKPGATYVVKVLFWSTDSGLWGLRAGLNYAYGSRTNTWFDRTTAAVVKANLLAWQSSMPALFSESGRTLFAAPLGTRTANSSGQIKVFVHDLPATDSNLRTWYQGVAVSEIIARTPHLVDAASGGTGFHRGVRGQALADPQIDWGDYYVAVPRSLEVGRGSSIRGVSTGLAAERYDWRTRNNQPRPPTLQFLRYSRDFNAELFLGVNLRGLIAPDGAGGFFYYDTQPSTMAALAADWVRYVNHIVPTYRQGDSISDSRDQAILNSITWSSALEGDSFDKLLAPGEATVPQIRYWEIGNEPTVGVTAYSVTNSFTLDPAAFHLRYSAVVQAMKAEDPNIKVGPTLIGGAREGAQLAAIVSDPTLPIDFIAYHPYERMGDLDDPSLITLHLGSIYSRQLAFYNDLRKVVAENGRDPDALEYAATEVNVSYWDINDTVKEAQMAHALGTVETVFSHARLGLVASHYWIWPLHRYYGTEYPLFKAYEKLRDHLGDTLVSRYAYGDTRLYTTRDSRTGELAVWALNFSNGGEDTVDLEFQNLPQVERATLLRLQDLSGTTTLQSANLAPDMAGGPTMNVDWTAADLTGQDFTHYQLRLPAATLSVIVIQPGLGRVLPGFVEESGEKRFVVTFSPVPYASDVRYRLLRSSDLETWQVVRESGPGLSGSVSLSDNLPATNSTSRFFRVAVLH